MNLILYFLIGYIIITYITCIIISGYAIYTQRLILKEKSTKGNLTFLFALSLFIAFSPVTIITFLFKIIKDWLKNE